MRLFPLYKICTWVVTLSFFGCNTGYQKENGEWAYVTWDEGSGRKVFPLQADEETFKILQKPEYAKDKSSVFYKGRVIPEADPSSYNLLEGGNYARDKGRVFLFYYEVINADPVTFVEIKFPYAKDKEGIFCGTLPMDVQNTNEFEVIRSSSSYQAINKDEFIKQNKEYAYLDTVQVKAVVYGEGSARTKSEYFEGFKKVQ